MDPKLITYHDTPEETAECGYCLHRDNVTAFEPADGGRGSECPECGGTDDSVPSLDVPQIMEEAKVLAEALTALTAERDALKWSMSVLTQTADGVPVYHYQDVWVRWGGNVVQGIVAEVRATGILASISNYMRPRYFHSKDTYSTEAAAKAASEDP